jgi:hypothetical protein
MSNKRRPTSVAEYEEMERNGDFDIAGVRCKECKYWRMVLTQADDGEAGACYRYPPVFDPSWLKECINHGDIEFETQEDTLYWARPIIDHHSFCGEHVKRLPHD